MAVSGTTEKLFFMLGLIDQISGPASAVEKRFLKIQKNVNFGLKELAVGGSAVTAAFLGLNRLTGPARDMNKALGEVASLDVSVKELRALDAASKRFAGRFGGDAAEIARSAYDIQSAIPGLAAGALAVFTYQEALLTKAGKSNNATISAYFGTMYNIFDKEAKKIGQAKWIEGLTGKTAEAIKIFKTTGDGMSQAFTNIGSSATEMGVSLDEQMAVLGTLQATMGGAQAGTAYKGFVTKLAQGQQTLGVSFKGADGQLLPVYEILDRIKTRIGSLDKDQQVARLTSAFGETGAQAVLNMISKTDQLRDNITRLSQIDDASGAEKMAASMIDPYERFHSVLKVVQITLGQAVLPAVNLALDAVSGLLRAFQWLLDWFPPLRWAVAGVILTVTALTMAWALLKIQVGATALWDALIVKLKLMRAWLVLNHVITRQMTAAQSAAAVAQWLWNKSLGSAVLWSGLASAAQWVFNASLYGCPLVWVVGGIMLLVGAIALLIVYWDEVCAWVMKYSNYLLMLLGPVGWIIAAFKNWDKISAFLEQLWGSFRKVCPNIANLIEKIVWIIRGAIGGAIDFIRGAFGGIYNFFLWVFGGIGRGVSAMWSGMIDSGRAVYEWIAGKLLPVFQVLGTLFGWIGDLGGMIGAAVAGLFGRIDGWIGKLLRLLAKIPGLEFLSPEVSAGEVRSAEVVPNVTAAGRKSDVSAGGIRGGVTNNRTTNFGGVTINTTRFPGPGELEDYVALQA